MTMACSCSFAYIPLTIILILTFSRPSYQNQVSSKNNGFSVDLIHRDSIRSPLHNPSYTSDDQMRAAIRRSISRAHYLHHATASSQNVALFSYDSDIIESSSEYLMTIKIGTPSRSIMAIADTGSDLVWTNCVPCEDCYKQDAPLFDPKSSSTYVNLDCSSNFCAASPATGCTNNLCQYDMQYGGGSSSSGTLAQDTFTFDTSDGKAAGVNNIVFGCAHQSQGTFTSNMIGIVGLGGGSISLVNQLGPSVGKRFSYCLVPYSAGSMSSKLNFGSNALFSDPNAHSMNLISGDSQTFYTVSLSNIAIGGNSIEAVVNNIFIDSGTTLNVIHSDTLDKIVEQLQKLIPISPVSDSSYQLCYAASDVQNSNITFPDITYTFGTTTLTLGSENSFIALNGKMCLGTIASTGVSVQILGNVAQQGFHFGYDLDERKVYFAPADCTKL